MVAEVEMNTSKCIDKREGVLKISPMFLYYQDAGAFHCNGKHQKRTSFAVEKSTRADTA